MSDILSRYLPEDEVSLETLKAAYLVACNAFDGTAFREDYCSQSEQHAETFEKMMNVKASAELKGAFQTWIKSLPPVSSDEGTALMRRFVEESNQKVIRDDRRA